MQHATESWVPYLDFGAWALLLLSRMTRLEFKGDRLYICIEKEAWHIPDGNNVAY